MSQPIDPDHLPCPSCVVPADVAARIVAMETKIDQIHNALVGDNFGNKGIIGRLDIVERAIDNHNQKFLAWGGMVIGAVAILEFFKSKLGI